MLVSIKTLGRYVDIAGITAEQLKTELTNAGLEVEGIETLVTGTNLTVGYVLDCVPHPDSDHLNITQVDLGDRHEQIVCGASNIAKGQYVIVAQVGAKLKDMEIKAAKVRGVESNGMICSLSELGVAEKFIPEEHKEGITVLPKSTPGSNPLDVLGMNDEILDISLTPNRSDFLAYLSIAHEVSALFKRPLTLPEFENASKVGKASQLTVSSETEKAPLFLGKVVQSVTVKESPLWMREMLMGSGIKPINNIVDISNVVMLETGQPLHFYDLADLSPLSLTVRDDIEGNYFALDGHTYSLIKGDQVIVNGEKPVGIAGIMGLGNSMIKESTQAIVIEAARFNHVGVRQTASRIGINTDSSARFTKAMDNAATFKAMDRAVQLLVEYADATGLEETVQYGDMVQTVSAVSVTLSKINAYLGTQFKMEEVVDVFTRLYFKPEVNGDVITCHAPSFRKDIEVDVDLIEEVIRVIGFDVLEETLPMMDETLGSLTPFQTSIRSIEKMMLGFGANQINSYTLVDYDKTQGDLAVGTPISLLSPLSDKRAYIRTQLFPSMVEVLAYNNSHKVSDGLYFEHSMVYSKEHNTNRLGIIGSGLLFEENWTNTKVELNFFTIKGLLINVFDRLGYSEKRFTFETLETEDQRFHPFKSARILLNRKPLGVIGHLHPSYAESLDLKDTVYAELDLDFLLAQKSGQVKATPVAKYPTMKRSLAISVDKSITVQALTQAIEKAGKRYLVNLNVFDLYQSEKLGEKQSIAFELTFGQDRTMEVSEVNEVVEAITEELVKRFNVEIR